jgi:hypothetical protein
MGARAVTLHNTCYRTLRGDRPSLPLTAASPMRPHSSAAALVSKISFSLLKDGGCTLRTEGNLRRHENLFQSPRPGGRT